MLEGALARAPMNFLEELKRRRVVRVAGVYAAIAFVVWQAADIAFPALHLPGWMVTAVVALTVIGLPIALVLAWAFDVTPVGVVRTDADRTGDHVVVARSTLRAQRIAAIAGVLVLAVAGGAFVALRDRGDHGATDIDRSIAVLPFANLTGQSEDEYFSDGITEDVLTQLAKVADLRVISRGSVMEYKGVARGAREVGDALGVAHIVMGSVRREGSRVRVAAQLIEARTDRNLWAETYDRELTGIFAIQSEIAQQIARALQARLSADVQSRIAEAPTVDLTAYDLYLKAREERRENNNRLVARTTLRQALRLDPEFGLAWAELALTYVPLSERPTAADLDSAALHARRAVALASDRAETHIALGTALRRANRPVAEWEPSYHRAHELSPSEGGALAGLGFANAVMGRRDEALRWRKLNVGVSPGGGQLRQLGLSYEGLGDDERARPWFEQAVASSPHIWFFHNDLFRLHLRRGELAAAADRVDAMLTLAPEEGGVWMAAAKLELARGDTAAAIHHLEHIATLGNPALELGVLHWKASDTARAEAIFRVYETPAGTTDEAEGEYRPAFRAAIVHAARADTAAAVRWLNEAARFTIDIVAVEMDVLPDELLQLPRFRKLMADARTERERQRQRAVREGWW